MTTPFGSYRKRTMMRSNRLAACLSATTLLAASCVATAALADVKGSYTLSKVTFQGNAQVSTEELEAALPYKAGDSIDQAGLQADAAAVGAVYQKHNVGASISQRFSMLHNKATLAYTLEEKAPVAPTVTHVGITADTVTVTGNARIKTADILAAANIRPGQTVTQDQIQAAQAAISGLYKKANIGSSVGFDFTNAAQAQHINLVFKITEKPDDN